MTSDYYYVLDKCGEPVCVDDVLIWAKWFETADRRLAKTEVGDGVRVSTVFLGLDHSFGSGRPLLWETLVFGGPLDGEMCRYETRLQAARGHDEMVARVRGHERVEGNRKIVLE